MRRFQKILDNFSESFLTLFPEEGDVIDVTIYPLLDTNTSP